MKRTAIFAHFDKNSRIDEYVLYYLCELRAVVDDIVFVSDSDLPVEEIRKVNNLVSHCIIGRHGEYDFGSYKRGYLYLQERGLLSGYDELVLCNDSCFGPLIEFPKIWNQIYEFDPDQNSYKSSRSKGDLDQRSEANPDLPPDFWGISYYEDKKNPLHIQSYFLVFNKAVFLSDVFDSFMHSIKKEASKKELVRKYEIGLTQLLLNNNFRMKTFMNDSIEYACLSYLPYFDTWPFIKTMLVKNNFSWLCRKQLSKLFRKKNLDYPLEMILNYADRFSFVRVLRKVKNLKRAIFRPSLKKGRVDIFGKSYFLRRKNHTNNTTRRERPV